MYVCICICICVYVYLYKYLYDLGKDQLYYCILNTQVTDCIRSIRLYGSSSMITLSLCHFVTSSAPPAAYVHSTLFIFLSSILCSVNPLIPDIINDIMIIRISTNKYLISI